MADRAEQRDPTPCLAQLTASQGPVAQHAGLSASYRALRASSAFQSFDTAQVAVVEHALRDFRLGGAELPAADQARVKTLRVELAELGRRFGEHVLDATQTYRLNCADPSRLAGLPDTVRSRARATAERNGEAGWSLTLDAPCYLPAMAHLADRDLRRTLYEAYVTRASERGPDGGRFDNGPLLHDILTRRQELARTLGFANYAELSLATKTAPSTSAVLDFLRDLARLARPAAEHELATLRHFARTELGLDELEAWDLSWCQERYRERHLALADETLRPYFPLPRVLQGLFDITGKVFGLRFEELAGIETWAPEVRFFAVLNDDRNPLGFFYLDPYARDGKRGGAWMDECLVRWRHGSVCQLPVAYLTCNFTPPLDASPSLLSHDEVRTLFHEFGHGLHHLLTEVDYPAVAGINGVAWDAVELPSQLLENWCWEEAGLEHLAGHYASGAPLPADLRERLRASRHFLAGLQMLRQVEFALFDFRVHLEYAPGLDIQTLLDAVRGEVAVVRAPDWNRFQHGFTHVFAGGYAAGYYSYKWAEVLAADAFAAFEESGVFDRATATRFLDSILSRGGSRDPLEAFIEFRGRKPDIAPLLRQHGIAA